MMNSVGPLLKNESSVEVAPIASGHMTAPINDNGATELEQVPSMPVKNKPEDRYIFI